MRFENICASPLENFSFEKPLNTLLAQSGVKGIEELLGTRFETLIKLVGQPSCHPLKGLRISRAMVIDSDNLVKTMLKDARLLNEMQGKAEQLRQAKTLRQQLLRDNTPDFLKEDVSVSTMTYCIYQKNR